MVESHSGKINLPLIAYRELIGIIKNEETLFWSRNQAFLAITAAMIAILGYLQKQQIGEINVALRFVNIAQCLFGIFIAILWNFIIHRSEDFYNHWYEQLRYLERTYLYPIDIFNKAEEYFITGKVQLGLSEFRLNRFQKHFRIYKSMRIVSMLTLLIWISLIIYFICFY